VSLSLPRRLFRLFLPRILFGEKQRRALSLSATVVSPRIMSATARPGVSNRPSIVNGLADVPPDAPDADLDAEPELLMCPLTRAVFRDPVMVVDSGHTYERDAILSHFECNGARDPLTNCALSSTKVMTNWVVKQIVQAWLDKHPSGTRIFDDRDVGVLRTWRAMCPALQDRWPEAARPEDWKGVTMEDGRVVKLRLPYMGLGGTVPAEIGQLTSLTVLDLSANQLSGMPEEIGQLTSLRELYLKGNQLSSMPAVIGQLTLLERLNLEDNQLTSLLAEIGQLASLRELNLRGNQLTSVPAEIGQLTSLRELSLLGNELTSLPAEIWQLRSMETLYLLDNKLTSLPAEIGQLTSLRELHLRENQLTSVPAAIRKLRAAGCRVYLDDDVTVDE